MPELPNAEIESPTDAELAGRCVPDLTWADERIVAACAMNIDDETLAERLSVSITAIRGQRFRAAHKILDLAGLPPNRLYLGRWCMFHWDCCLVRVGKRIMDGTWLIP